MSFLSKWSQEIKKYLFTYKEGFFVFPMFTSDPEQLVEGFKNTPMVKYDEAKQYTTTRTLFIDGDTYFKRLESGLWIIYTNITFKKNICFEMVYNPDKSHDYYAIAVDASTTARQSTHYSKKGEYIENHSYYWRLVKPGTLASNYNLAGTKSRIICLYIHREWFQQYFLNHGNADATIIKWDKDPNREAIFFPNSSLTKVTALEAIYGQFENQDKQELDLLELKSNVFALLSSFVNELKETRDNVAILKPQDEAKVLKAERLLKAAVSKGFPTINTIAKKVGLSETKLKADFKAVYRKTLFQYFSDSQMDIAEQMLKTTDMPINQIAYSLGYSHAGKFSEAFKKIKGVSPSVIKTVFSSGS